MSNIDYPIPPALSEYELRVINVPLSLPTNPALDLAHDSVLAFQTRYYLAPRDWPAKVQPDSTYATPRLAIVAQLRTKLLSPKGFAHKRCSVTSDGVTLLGYGKGIVSTGREVVQLTVLVDDVDAAWWSSHSGDQLGIPADALYIQALVEQDEVTWL
jgi:hypothetical protein